MASTNKPDEVGLQAELVALRQNFDEVKKQCELERQQRIEERFRIISCLKSLLVDEASNAGNTSNTGSEGVVAKRDDEGKTDRSRKVGVRFRDLSGSDAKVKTNGEGRKNVPDGKDNRLVRIREVLLFLENSGEMSVTGNGTSSHHGSFQSSSLQLETKRLLDDCENVCGALKEDLTLLIKQAKDLRARLSDLKGGMQKRDAKSDGGIAEMEVRLDAVERSVQGLISEIEEKKKNITLERESLKNGVAKAGRDFISADFNACFAEVRKLREVLGFLDRQLPASGVSDAMLVDPKAEQQSATAQITSGEQTGSLLTERQRLDEQTASFAVERKRILEDGRNVCAAIKELAILLTKDTEAVRARFSAFKVGCEGKTGSDAGVRSMEVRLRITERSLRALTTNIDEKMRNIALEQQKLENGVASSGISLDFNVFLAKCNNLRGVIALLDSQLTASAVSDAIVAVGTNEDKSGRETKSEKQSESSQIELTDSLLVERKRHLDNNEHLFGAVRELIILLIDDAGVIRTRFSAVRKGIEGESEQHLLSEMEVRLGSVEGSLQDLQTKVEEIKTTIAAEREKLESGVAILDRDWVSQDMNGCLAQVHKLRETIGLLDSQLRVAERKKGCFQPKLDDRTASEKQLLEERSRVIVCLKALLVQAGGDGGSSSSSNCEEVVANPDNADGHDSTRAPCERDDKVKLKKDAKKKKIPDEKEKLLFGIRKLLFSLDNSREFDVAETGTSREPMSSAGFHRQSAVQPDSLQLETKRLLDVSENVGVLKEDVMRLIKQGEDVRARFSALQKGMQRLDVESDGRIIEMEDRLITVERPLKSLVCEIEEKKSSESFEIENLRNQVLKLREVIGVLDRQLQTSEVSDAVLVGLSEKQKSAPSLRTSSEKTGSPMLDRKHLVNNDEKPGSFQPQIDERKASRVLDRTRLLEDPGSSGSDWEALTPKDFPSFQVEHQPIPGSPAISPPSSEINKCDEQTGSLLLHRKTCLGHNENVSGALEEVQSGNLQPQNDKPTGELEASAVMIVDPTAKQKSATSRIASDERTSPHCRLNIDKQTASLVLERKRLLKVGRNVCAFLNEILVLLTEDAGAVRVRLSNLKKTGIQGNAELASGLRLIEVRLKLADRSLLSLIKNIEEKKNNIVLEQQKLEMGVALSEIVRVSLDLNDFFTKVDNVRGVISLLDAQLRASGVSDENVAVGSSEVKSQRSKLKSEKHSQVKSDEQFCSFLHDKRRLIDNNENLCVALKEVIVMLIDETGAVRSRFSVLGEGIQRDAEQHSDLSDMEVRLSTTERSLQALLTELQEKKVYLEREKLKTDVEMSEIGAFALELNGCFAQVHKLRGAISLLDAQLRASEVSKPMPAVGVAEHESGSVQPQIDSQNTSLVLERQRLLEDSGHVCASLKGVITLLIKDVGTVRSSLSSLKKMGTKGNAESGNEIRSMEVRVKLAERSLQAHLTSVEEKRKSITLEQETLENGAAISGMVWFSLDLNDFFIQVQKLRGVIGWVDVYCKHQSLG